MAHQVTVNFNELLVTIVVKHGMLAARRNVQMVLTIRPQSILVEFPLSNSMEPLRAGTRKVKQTCFYDRQTVNQESGQALEA